MTSHGQLATRLLDRALQAPALADLARMVVPHPPTVEVVLAAMDEDPCGGNYGHLVRAFLRPKLGPA